MLLGRRYHSWLAGFVSWSLILPFILLTAGQAAPQWHSKVDPWVLAELSQRSRAEAVLFLTQQADLSPAHKLSGKAAKGSFVYDTLSTLASRTQGDLLSQLQALQVPHRPYWIANMIWIEADSEQLALLAGRADVARVYANPTIKPLLPAVINPLAPAPGGVEWNIALINAPAVWQLGVNGAGAVIGGQDTGYRWDHPALQTAYRGWNGATADHNYHWHDAIHSGGGSCGPDTTSPCDDEGHGTHTMGTMVGDDGGSNQIGVAPGARWIGCRNMDVGNGTPTTYSECFQWFVAPTDLNDQNPDPSLAPDVINNSWSCPASEGCTDLSMLQTVVENAVAAGIVVVASAGNQGPGCGTVNRQPAIYDASFSVAATNSSDTLAGFSSRGPVTVDGSNRLKPDIAAPGSSIRSSLRTGGYGLKSGTSMAAPHVAGLTALLIEANPSLRGDVAALEAVMQTGAMGLTTTQSCGGISGSSVPNNSAGHGRIDALQSVLQVIGLPQKAFLPVFNGQ